MTVTIADVRAAAGRLDGHAVETPLVSNRWLDKATGGRVFLKAECLQITGSFKFRGAYNRLSAMSEDERRAGVVAFSSGNHAQGIARAAKMLDIPAVIVMPNDAPGMKAQRTRDDGAEIIWYERLEESREQIAEEISEARGSIIVPSFDDPYIVAGQGTAGLEAARQLADAGLEADVAVICCGGGGLASGMSLALPGAEIVLAEPDGYDDAGESLAAGQIVPVWNPGRTIQDALQTLRISDLTFGILSAHKARGVSVTDDEAYSAMRFAYEELKLVLEPGGAAALAALIHRKVDVRGKVVIATLSGGNVDPEIFRRCLS